MAERDIDEVERIVREFVASLGAEPTDATTHLRWTIRVGAVRSLLKRTLERADAALAPVVPSTRTTGGRDMARDDEPSSTRARVAQERDRRAAEAEGTSFTYAGPETKSKTSIGEAIRKNSEALDRASDEALSLAAERIAMRDAANGLCGPFMVPASERSHTPGSPPTAGCGCHLPGINGHDPRYCKERERIIGTQNAAHLEQTSGVGQRTFTRAEVLTVLRAEKTRQSVNGIHHAAIWALDTLIKIFDRME